MIEEAQAAIRTFHEVMIGPSVAPTDPVDLADYNGDLRCALIEEEAQEFRYSWNDRNREGMIDGLCDLLYVTIGAAVEMGVELEPFFREVHRANMRKVGGTMREDGKQLKPADWTAPDISATYQAVYGRPVDS